MTRRLCPQGLTQARNVCSSPLHPSRCGFRASLGCRVLGPEWLTRVRNPARTLPMSQLEDPSTPKCRNSQSEAAHHLCRNGILTWKQTAQSQSPGYASTTTQGSTRALPSSLLHLARLVNITIIAAVEAQTRSNALRLLCIFS